MDFAERYGPWAVVLGASEGTGREFARQIAAHGVPSILIARREAPLAALADEIRKDFGVECVTASIDLSKTDALARIIAATGERDVGLYVCNAGGDPNGNLFLELELSAWMELIQRNVVTMMGCCHHFAAPMQARGRGGLLLVNSGACYGGASTMGPYAGSKAFMLCFAEALWAEMRASGVDVLTLVLSRTDTPEFKRFLAAKGMPMPADIDTPEAVVKLGLERLPHGPIQNVGEADDQRGMSATSAAERRARVIGVSQAIDQLYGRS